MTGQAAEKALVEGVLWTVLTEHVETVNWHDGRFHCKCGWTDDLPLRKGRWALDEKALPMQQRAAYFGHVAQIQAAAIEQRLSPEGSQE